MLLVKTYLEKSPRVKIVSETIHGGLKSLAAVEVCSKLGAVQESAKRDNALFIFMTKVITLLVIIIIMIT